MKLTKIPKISGTTWIALIVHLFLFSFISYTSYVKDGFHWSLLAIAIIPPLIFFWSNVDEDIRNQSDKFKK